MDFSVVVSPVDTTFMVDWRYLANVYLSCVSCIVRGKNWFLGLFKNVTFDSRKNAPWKVAPEQKMPPPPPQSCPRRKIAPWKCAPEGKMPPEKLPQ